ncbi:hypothetical protein RIF29_26223 [Crotalaria pallida]|uniref:Uncharacterized protein n=1 Tax=Crotalaria pallida TaxID=3830 RepID=A0AAN9EN37_CROPI
MIPKQRVENVWHEKESLVKPRPFYQSKVEDAEKFRKGYIETIQSGDDAMLLKGLLRAEGIMTVRAVPMGVNKTDSWKFIHESLKMDVDGIVVDIIVLNILEKGLSPMFVGKPARDFPKNWYDRDDEVSNDDDDLSYIQECL